MLKICDGEPFSFLFESVEGGETRGRYSIIGLKPDLIFRCKDGKAEINQKSGIYLLKVKYNMDQSCSGNSNYVAGIVIGEVTFNSEGYAIAEGADWDRLLNNQRQTQLPYSHGARGVPIWTKRKISEQWQNDEVLTFKIDTNEKTIVYQRGDTPKKTFWNLLHFSNNVKYPDYLRVYAFAGVPYNFDYSEQSLNEFKLTIIR